MGDKTVINLEIVVPNQTRYLGLIGNIGEEVARFLDGNADNRGDLAYHLNLVLTEAMVNAIHYGSTENRQDTVRVHLRIEDDVLCLKVYDQGQGFDLNNLPPPELDSLREDGRGIFLIRSLMDDVTYQKTDEGNVLAMYKKLD
jgi:serine/threonine-protein kinase RsbW